MGVVLPLLCKTALEERAFPAGTKRHLAIYKKKTYVEETGNAKNCFNANDDGCACVSTVFRKSCSTKCDVSASKHTRCL